MDFVQEAANIAQLAVWAFLAPQNNRTGTEAASLVVAALKHFREPLADERPIVRAARLHATYTVAIWHADLINPRSEEHTSELQSLMRISYAVFCLKKKKKR